MTRGVILSLAFVAPFAATGQDASGFAGVYRQNALGSCTAMGEEGGAIRIEDAVFYGAGATCQMTDPVDIRDMDAALFDFVCERDEAIWTSRFFLSLADDGGLIVVSDGFAFKYDRCDPDGAVGTVTTAPTLGISNSPQTGN